MNMLWCILILVPLCYAEYSSSSPSIKKVFSGGQHFEGPHWSHTENALYWVDQAGQRALRMDGETGNVTTRDFAYGVVSLIVTVKDYPKYVVLTLRSGVYLMNWEDDSGDKALRLLTAVDLGKPDTRCNDGKVDAKGRLWFGTMGKFGKDFIELDQGSIYTLDACNYPNPELKVRPVSISNGIAWSGDNKLMFYSDTVPRNIDVFDFDLELGTIGNRRTLFSFDANKEVGYPDGMTIDTDDNLWVACIFAGKMIKIDSRTGKVIDQVFIPGVAKVTSMIFGGPDLSTLYVTTSKDDLTAAELAQQPDAGSLFAVEGTGSRGRPENQFLFLYPDTY